MPMKIWRPMKTWNKAFRPFLVVLVMATFAVTLKVAAQEAEAPEGLDTAAMEEAWLATMSPGEPHEWLAQMAGEWTFETSMWMNPSAPPTKSTGESTKTMIMEGRYLQEEMKGEMMGRPFTGRGITGFDNVTQEVVGSWIDNMSTGLAIVRGQIDPETKRVEVRGEMKEPASGETLELRMVTSVADENHHTFEYFLVLPDGNEMKQMEIHYTRKGSES